ncbi:hypothetical protein F5X97DRAFT_143077 [Nemania serpens]|nr:hypothetical protein F5X97DRAFT_143077 [Nemania serpens]
MTGTTPRARRRIVAYSSLDRVLRTLHCMLSGRSDRLVREVPLVPYSRRPSCLSPMSWHRLFFCLTPKLSAASTLSIYGIRLAPIYLIMLCYDNAICPWFYGRTYVTLTQSAHVFRRSPGKGPSHTQSREVFFFRRRGYMWTRLRRLTNYAPRFFRPIYAPSRMILASPSESFSFSIYRVRERLRDIRSVGSVCEMAR